jgi:hypothetical protein
MATERSVTVRLKADIGNFNAQLLAAGAAAKAFTSELDSSNDRMSNLIQTAVALGPALIPVMGGAAVGAAALGTSLTFAATGAGVAALALSGVGTALTALNKYQLDPTAANLETLNEQLGQIAPAGQNFVLFLDSLGPKLDELQATAQGGFLPGLQEGIEQVMQSFPAVNALVADLSGTLGDLAASGGEALNSPFWQGFLADFSSNASAELSKFAQAIGNVTTGLAGMFQAFLPVSTDFTSGLLDMSQAFSEWGQNLSDNEGFQDFVAYVRDNGPAAVEALASLADALIAIVQAAAPVGSAVLPVITAMAQGLAAIARSPAGPILFGAAAGLAAFARAAALLKVLNAPVLFNGIAALGGPGTTAQTARIRALGAGIGVLALSLTDLDDRAGVSNILTGAAVGSAFGPLGVAIGTAVGALKEFHDENDAINDTLERTKQIAADHPFDFAAQLTASRDALASLNEETAKATGKSMGAGAIPGFGVISFAYDKLAGSASDAADETEGLIDKTKQVKEGFAAFAAELGGDRDSYQEIGDTLLKLGYTVEGINDLMANRNASAPDAIAWQQAIRAVEDYTAAQESVPGRTKATKDAIADLDDELIDTASAADKVKASLDALFGPQLNMVEATDQWTFALRHLNDDLAKHNKTLEGNSDAAIKNRAAIGDVIGKYEDMLVAGAGVNETTDQFNNRMRTQYFALLDAGKAAGIARSDMRDYLATLGLTPKLIATKISAETADAMLKLHILQDTLSRIQSKTVYVNVVTTAGQGVQAGGLQIEADGGVVDYYAKGGMREKHVAQIAPAGAMRVWAEPETGGEAYIPLAPEKRGRSRSIADETVSRLGGVVQWMADGGVGARSAGTSTVAGSSSTTLATEIRGLRDDLRTVQQHVFVDNGETIGGAVRQTAAGIAKGTVAGSKFNDRMNGWATT